MKRLIYLTVALALVMTACSKEDGDTSDSGSPDDGVIRVDATRTTTVSESFGGSELSLSVIYSDQYTADPGLDPYTVVDSKWTKDTSGVWSTEEIVLWRNEADTVSIYAFAPYVSEMYANMASGVNFAVSKDQAANNTYSSDLMTYKFNGFTPKIDATDTTGGYLTSAGAVPITFTHALSQLVISLTYGDEFDDAYDGEDPKVVSVTLHAVPNLRYKFIGETIDLGTYSGDTLVDGSDAVADILAYNSDDNVYTVILPPQTFAAGTDMITITVDSENDGNSENYEDFIFTIPASTAYSFSAKSTYTMAIRVGKDTVKLDSSIIETLWVDGGSIGGGDSELDRD